MWHEYLAYLIIAAAFLWMAAHALRKWLRPEPPSCADCTADCKLRDLKRNQDCKKSGKRK